MVAVKVGCPAKNQNFFSWLEFLLWDKSAPNTLRLGFDLINGSSCADIDECLERNSCPENAFCENQLGDYKQGST